jgi:hypothetical protein
MAPNFLVYEAGKSAVIGMTRQLACDLGPRGIRVTAICPGHIVTARIQAAMWDANPGGLRFFEQQHPLRRCGRPVDIADAIAFLCSAEASFITGHALVVDGGHSIQLQENLGVHLAHYIQAHPDTPLPYGGGGSVGRATLSDGHTAPSAIAGVPAGVPARRPGADRTSWRIGELARAG